MKKLIVGILSIAMCFSTVGCFESKETRAKSAYENIQTAYEIADSLRSDIEYFYYCLNICNYSFLTGYEDYENFMSSAEEILINHLGGDPLSDIIVRPAFKETIKKEYGEDFLTEITANTICGAGCINYFCNESKYKNSLSAKAAAFARTIIRVYELKGEIKKAENALAEADKQLQKLKDKDYEHYEALKKYYDSTIAYFDCSRLSEAGSDFNSTFEFLITYEDDIKNIRMDIWDIKYEYELEDLFEKS